MENTVKYPSVGEMAQTLTIKKQIPFEKFRVNGVRAMYAVSIVFNQVGFML